MKLREICEEFVDAVKVFSKEYHEIFRNPSLKELQNVLADNLAIRFIIDFRKQNIYVFNEYLLHSTASRKLGVDYNYPNWDNRDYAFGVGVIHLGKIKENLSTLDTSTTRKFEIAEGKHEWLKKYFVFIGKPRRL